MTDRETILDHLRAFSEIDEAFGPEGACPMALEEGDPAFAVVTGENAGGKSYVSKHLGGAMAKGAEVIALSMRLRTTSGISRAMVFGDESWESTGQLSTKSVLMALKTVRGRDKPVVLVLDEPDIGLGEGYQAAMGDLLAAFAADRPDNLVGFVIVTHCRAMVERLLVAGPTLVRVGDDLRPTRQWVVEGDRPKTVEDLEGLPKLANRRFRAVTSMEKTLKAERDAAPQP